MKKILFMGDSITDAERTTTGCGQGLGCGYARLVSAHLGYNYPGEYEFINRGINGNRIVDLYARIKADVIELAPDYMSILIGVNDVWHDLSEIPNGVAPDKFFRVYDMFISEIKEALPNIKLMIFLPFVLEGEATAKQMDFFRREVPKRAEMAKKIGDKYGIPVIELQSGFDALCEKAEPSFWLYDGVHPSFAGHEFIKSKWLEAFEEIK
ncbi:MAG: SGNH/GDSL hydrolase family protein [Clostridia bacterium]|nr:SGNH/GDSL hydrolase family protein [Clostridia bacterium]